MLFVVWLAWTCAVLNAVVDMATFEMRAVKDMGTCLTFEMQKETLSSEWLFL